MVQSMVSVVVIYLMVWVRIPIWVLVVWSFLQDYMTKHSDTYKGFVYVGIGFGA